MYLAYDQNALHRGNGIKIGLFVQLLIPKSFICITFVSHTVLHNHINDVPSHKWVKTPQGGTKHDPVLKVSV